MEGNGLLPPPQPISFYRHDNPNQRYERIAAGTTFPITVSIYNAIKLYFTVTRNNVTIITSIDNAPHFVIIPRPHNNNIRARRNNNNNSGALHLHNNVEALHLHNNVEALHLQNYGEALHFMTDGELLDFLDSEEALQFQNNEEALHPQNNGETLVLNLHHVPDIENGNREALEFHDLLGQFHGLALRNLHTFPSYIHITSNNQTFALHVTRNNTIDVNDQALPIPPPQNDDNYHVINQHITLPLTLIILFNNPNNNTIMSIFIEFHIDNTVFIYANSEIGFLEWAAVLDFIPEAPDD